MLIGFAGLKGSGKDTAAEVLINEYGFTRIAFADAVRDVTLAINPLIPFKTLWGTDVVSLSQLVTQFGWDKIKRDVPEVRRLLQVVGTEAGRMILGENVWIDILSKKYPDIADSSARYVITDCRFDNEVDFVRNNNGFLVWINRPGLSSDGHSSESEHIRDLATAIVHNDSTIEEFQEDVRLLMFMRGIDPIESRFTN